MSNSGTQCLNGLVMQPETHITQRVPDPHCGIFKACEGFISDVDRKGRG